MRKMIYRGNLEMIGSATLGGSGIFDSPTTRTYSVIEIGDTILKSVRASAVIDSYLTKALNDPDEVELEINIPLFPWFLIVAICLFVLGVIFKSEPIGVSSFPILFIGLVFFKTYDNWIVAVTTNGKRYTN